MTLKGADLLAWAQKEADKWYQNDGAAEYTTMKPVEVLIAEAYLRGAIDALAEETDTVRAGPPPVPDMQARASLGDAAILSDGSVGP